jgi:hypothetical protein
MAYDPPRIVMPEKEEENVFVSLCYPTNTEMATLCNFIFL